MSEREIWIACAIAWLIVGIAMNDYRSAIFDLFMVLYTVALLAALVLFVF